jgi:hypothetical protein
MEGRRRNALLVALCVLAWLLPAAAAQAATPTLAPTEVTLTPGRTATGVLLVANPERARVEVRVRTIRGERSVSAKVTKPSFALGPKRSRAVTYTVSRESEGSGQAVTIQFVVTSMRTGHAAQRSVVGLTVKAAASAPLVEAKIDSSVATINENRPGAAKLVLTNPRETAVKVTAVGVTAPDGTTVELTCPSGTVQAKPGATASGCAEELAARSQAAMPLTFTTTDSVVPGPRSVLVSVQAGSEQSVVTSTTFTVDVFAEADILKAIGVPVFLLLPGVIIVLTAWFLITHASPLRPLTAGLSLGGVAGTATVTAVLGLAISLGVAQLYPHLTEQFVPRHARDYLKAYGFRDFYYVIGYSFAIALAVWIVVTVGFVVIRALFLPWPYDKPKSLLRKIGMRGLLKGGTKFSLVATDGAKHGVLLERRGERALVAPRIEVQVNGGPQDLLATIAEHASKGHAIRLWLTIARRRKHTSLTYRGTDIDALRVLDADKLQGNQGESAIVQT